MKKFLLALFILTSSFSFSQTTIFQGNGKSDFGGAVGKGTLNVINSADSISIFLNKAAGPFDSVLVFYIDTLSTTGLSNTNQLVNFGTSDKYSKAVSAQSSSSTPTLTFPANFTPDIAIAFDKTGGKIYSFQSIFTSYGLFEANSFTLTPNGSLYGKTFSKSDLGLTPGQSVRFNFIGTYIDGNTVSRSAEGFGDPFTGYNGTAKTESSAPYTIKSFFTYNSATSLPVTLTNFKASTIQDKVQLSWSVAQETNMDGYEIQRSANGIQFSTIATLNANNNSANSSAYSFTDNAPLNGSNYYRLLIKEIGRKEFSTVVVAKMGGSKKTFKVQQVGKNLNIQLNNLSAGIYKLSIVNANGQIIHSSTLQNDGNITNKQIELKTALVKGVYNVVLQSVNEHLVQSLLIQ